MNLQFSTGCFDFPNRLAHNSTKDDRVNGFDIITRWNQCGTEVQIHPRNHVKAVPLNRTAFLFMLRVSGVI